MGFSIFPKNFKLLNNHKCRNRRGSDKKLWNTGNQVLKLENVKQLLSGEGGMDYEKLKQISRFNCPIVLNPSEATFDDVALHAILRQRLSPGTVEKRMRYARFMEKHVVPVDFRNPSYENFLMHMDYREQVEGASPHALAHEWKTMRMFLNAYGIPRWPYKLPPIPVSHKRILPFPGTVVKFWNYQYSDDKYENALYQYLFFHGFTLGVRIPAELITLKVDDIIFEDGHAYLTITETKKHDSQRTVVPEKAIMTSKVHKSMKNWIDKWRPKVENQYSGDSLYLQPNGKPFTVRYLGKKLSKHGKKVWKYFSPYDMRHWCAVARLIKTKVETGNFDVYTVRNFLGHETISSTQKYIRNAEQYYRQLPEDWISLVLKPRKKRS